MSESPTNNDQYSTQISYEQAADIYARASGCAAPRSHGSVSWAVIGVTVVIAVAVVGLGTVVARNSGGGGGDGAGSSASCAALIVWHGQTYMGVGGLVIQPAHGRPLGLATIPPCQDTGDQTQPGGAQHVPVFALGRTSPHRAIVNGTSVYVRNATHLPRSVVALLRVPACTEPQQFPVVARWGGVETSHKPKFDGDLRPPYRLDLLVTDGPAPLHRAQITAAVDSSTTGLLTPADVRTVLWTYGTLHLTMSCAGKAYHVNAIGSRTPGSP